LPNFARAIGQRHHVRHCDGVPKITLAPPFTLADTFEVSFALPFPFPLFAAFDHATRPTSRCICWPAHATPPIPSQRSIALEVSRCEEPEPELLWLRGGQR
jgi:hypothetical protein